MTITDNISYFVLSSWLKFELYHSLNREYIVIVAWIINTTLPYNSGSHIHFSGACHLHGGRGQCTSLALPICGDTGCAVSMKHDATVVKCWPHSNNTHKWFNDSQWSIRTLSFVLWMIGSAVIMLCFMIVMTFYVLLSLLKILFIDLIEYCIHRVLWLSPLSMHVIICISCTLCHLIVILSLMIYSCPTMKLNSKSSNTLLNYSQCSSLKRIHTHSSCWENGLLMHDQALYKESRNRQ